jgi:hypothetical protein
VGRCSPLARLAKCRHLRFNARHSLVGPNSSAWACVCGAEGGGALIRWRMGGWEREGDA